MQIIVYCWLGVFSGNFVDFLWNKYKYSWIALDFMGSINNNEDGCSLLWAVVHWWPMAKTEKTAERTCSLVFTVKKRTWLTGLRWIWTMLLLNWWCAGLNNSHFGKYVLLWSDMFVWVGQKTNPPLWAKVSLSRNEVDSLTVDHPGKK